MGERQSTKTGIHFVWKIVFKNMLVGPDNCSAVKRDCCAVIRMRAQVSTSTWQADHSAHMCSSSYSRIWCLPLASMHCHRQMHTHTDTYMHTHRHRYTHNTHLRTERDKIFIILCEFNTYRQNILCIVFPLLNSSQIHPTFPLQFVTFLKIHLVKPVLPICIDIGPSTRVFSTSEKTHS